MILRVILIGAIVGGKLDLLDALLTIDVVNRVQVSWEVSFCLLYLGSWCSFV